MKSAILLETTWINGYCFISSRRRHTRFDCDWSSDVCSSDLARLVLSMDAKTWELRRAVVYDQFENTVTMRFTDRKSTRLNSSHSQISYAVFCLKKKITPIMDIYTSYS